VSRRAITSAARGAKHKWGKEASQVWPGRPAQVYPGGTTTPANKTYMTLEPVHAMP